MSFSDIYIVCLAQMSVSLNCRAVEKRFVWPHVLIFLTCKKSIHISLVVVLSADSYKDALKI